MPWWAIICFILDGITISLSIGLIVWWFTKGRKL